MPVSPATARLSFPPTIEKVGKPFAIAEFWSVTPSVACRELIQNALDAHTATANSVTAHITFKTAKLSRAEIPALDQYLDALERSRHCWKDNPSICDYHASIMEYAEQDEIDVLYIIDNGKGFGPSEIEAVLGEGTPIKPDGSTGLHGIGHLTTFGMSGLQYIFYLGKSHSHLLAAGHAILSSHPSTEGELRAAHGYFVKRCKQTFDDPYEYCDQNDIPLFLQREADHIQGTGSIVAVLGFKGFHDESPNNLLPHDISQPIYDAVATNFAVALFQNRLSIEIQTEAGDHHTIDQSNILTFLQQRSEKGTGNYCNDAAHTLQVLQAIQDPDGQGHLRGTFSDCQIYLRNRMPNQHISIWRNGMLITSGYKGLDSGQFEGTKPFNAAILLSRDTLPRTAHDIVRKAEGPMHDKIEFKRLANIKEERLLRSLMGSIRDWIRNHAEHSGGESRDLENGIWLSTSHTDTVTEEEADDEFEESENSDTENGESKDDSKTGIDTKGKKTTIKNQSILRAQGRKIEDSYLINICPLKTMVRAFLEICKDTGKDPSCSGRIDEKPLVISAATLIASSGNVTLFEGKDQCRIPLPNVTKGVPIRLNLKFKSPPPNNVSFICRIGRVLDKMPLLQPDNR